MGSLSLLSKTVMWICKTKRWKTTLLTEGCTRSLKQRPGSAEIFVYNIQPNLLQQFNRAQLCLCWLDQRNLNLHPKTTGGTGSDLSQLWPIRDRQCGFLRFDINKHRFMYRPARDAHLFLFSRENCFLFNRVLKLQLCSYRSLVHSFTHSLCGELYCESVVL